MKFPRFADIILFENEQVIVVNKPPFLPSLEDRSGTNANLLDMARQYCPDAQVCHRLDRETSGAMIIAKNQETYRFISMQFEHRKITKKYHAIVGGIHQFKDNCVQLPLANNKGKVTIDRQEGKKAETVFNSIEYFKHYTLVECLPLTGRMHQIRIHLATQKSPIAGDVLYGGPIPLLSAIKKGYRLGKNEEEQALIKRFALHSYEVGFEWAEGQAIVIQAPYHKDFATLLKLLRKFDK